jgi:phage protein D
MQVYLQVRFVETLSSEKHIFLIVIDQEDFNWSIARSLHSRVSSLPLILNAVFTFRLTALRLNTGDGNCEEESRTFARLRSQP